MRTKLILTIFSLMFVWVSAAQAADEFQISYSCIDCHQDRYEEWSRSMHALSMRDPVFEAAYLRAIHWSSVKEYYRFDQYRFINNF